MRSCNLKISASLYHMVLTDKVKMSLFSKIKILRKGKNGLGREDMV